MGGTPRPGHPRHLRRRRPAPSGRPGPDQRHRPLTVGRHARPGPPDQPYRAIPGIDQDDPLAAYEHRRRPPLDQPRRHRPLHGQGTHVLPNTPRVLEEWDGFTYTPVGTAADLTEARRRTHGAEPHTDHTPPG
ncbi:DUF6087 family protein [Streptomyces sp. NPDC007883]|uniref:DUF6087 family protein n=1 Tax=Streptomyces sp. NPDC007883 TaxID=3155116 RepID=UPI0033E1A934